MIEWMTADWRTGLRWDGQVGWVSLLGLGFGVADHRRESFSGCLTHGFATYVHIGHWCIRVLKRK